MLEDHYVDRRAFVVGNTLTAADIVLYVSISASINSGIDFTSFPKLKYQYDQLDSNELIKSAQTRMLGNPTTVCAEIKKRCGW